MMIAHTDLPVWCAVASSLFQEMEVIKQTNVALYHHIMVHHTTIRKHC